MPDTNRKKAAIDVFLKKEQICGILNWYVTRSFEHPNRCSALARSCLDLRRAEEKTQEELWLLYR